MRSEAFFIFSHGAYTIFLPDEAKNATFAIGRQEQKCTQRNGPLAARGKSFWKNPRDAKRLSFEIKHVPLEAKN